LLPKKEEESVSSGFDNLIGHLEGGLKLGKKGKETDTINRITAAEFVKEVKVGAK
jgi:hypothetical protein